MTSTGTSGIPLRLWARPESAFRLFGGFHLSVPPEDEATRIIHTAIDNGVTFMDNAWEYADNESERRMGNALAQGGYRDKVFLMTKNCAHDRTAANSMVKLEESLRRLQTDHLDLWQIHEVTFPNDPDRIRPRRRSRGDAARERGGQGPLHRLHRAQEPGHLPPHAFAGFSWDTLQMPVSVLDANFNSFQTEIMPIAQEQGIGVIGMKSLAAGHLFDDPTIGITAEEAIRYALSQPIAFSAPGSTAWSSWSRTCASPAISCR